MSNKTTIVKVLPKDGEFSPSREDLERWRQRFITNQKTATEQGVASGEIEISTLPEKLEGEHYLTIVRVGDETFVPSVEDLENWRRVFEEAMLDPDFKIFTHPAVDIQVIDIGKIIDVE